MNNTKTTFRFAVCYSERCGMVKWCVIAAKTAREAVKTLRRYYPGYEVKGCYKEKPEWAWR